MSKLFKSKPTAPPPGTVPVNYSAPATGGRPTSPGRMPWAFAAMTNAGPVPIYASSGQQFPHYKPEPSAAGTTTAGDAEQVELPSAPPEHGRRRSMSLSALKLDSDSATDLTSYTYCSDDEDLGGLDVIIEDLDEEDPAEFDRRLSNKHDWKDMIRGVGLTHKQLRSVTPNDAEVVGGAALGVPPAVPRRTTTYETAKLQVALENLPKTETAGKGKLVKDYRAADSPAVPRKAQEVATKAEAPEQHTHCHAGTPVAVPAPQALPAESPSFSSLPNAPNVVSSAPPQLSSAPCLPGFSTETKEEKVKKGIELFQWAKYFEACGNLTESLQLYRQGLDKLHESYIEETDPQKMDFLQATMGYHFSRAEEVRALVSNPLEKSPSSTMSDKAMETLEQAEFHIREARSFDNGNLIDEAIVAYKKSLDTLKKMATDEEYKEKREHIAGRALIVEKRLVKLLKYRNMATKVLPYPYRLVYDIPNRAITKTGLGSLAQKQLEKQVEKHLIKDDPDYAKHKAKIEEKREKKEREKFLKSKEGKKMLKKEAKEAKEREKREKKELKRSKKKNKKSKGEDLSGDCSTDEDEL